MHSSWPRWSALPARAPPILPRTWWGTLHGIAAALPHFRRQGGGHFVTVASIGAHRVVPTSAVYSATKYAAWAITEGLRQELEPGIRVTTISPGVVESELAASITEPGAKEAMRTYRAVSIPADAIAGLARGGNSSRTRYR
ncbi:SDR family oxidoreductase [Nonomuraea sp. CA-141351]|uniref:SDR family oxidoreductase n=1 Tax=Nonomuraea sp. CA-141351 TaxID=3239996 RepID=UPI003D91DE89